MCIFVHQSNGCSSLIREVNMVYTNEIDVLIFGDELDKLSGTLMGGDLLRKLEEHNVVMEILHWGNVGSNGMPVVKFGASTKEGLIKFGIELYDVDAEEVEYVFFDVDY
jgi:hypothetical protein